MKRSLVDLARANERSLARNNMDDEVDFSTYAYDLQQLVEKSLKYLLTLKGIRYPFTHDIRELMDALDDDSITEILELVADTLTKYEATSRNNSDFFTTRKALLKMHEKVLPVYVMAVTKRDSLAGFTSEFQDTY